MKRITNYLRYAGANKLIVASAFVLVTASLVGFSLSGKMAHAATDIDNTPDCDSVAVIKCGSFSEAELRADYDANNYGDVQKIYSHFGISKSELSGFKNGIVYRNGNIEVDGKIVASDARTAARWNNPPAGATKIAGTDRAYANSTAMFANNGQTAFVKMNGDKFEFAVMKSCGNPVSGKPKSKPPVYACNALNMSTVAGKKDTYSFTTNATAQNGATIAKVVYEFGDGQKVEKTNPAEAVTHTYTKPGNYTAKVTVYVTVNGQTKTVVDAKCAKPVTVKPEIQKPVYACTTLNARMLERNKYEFTAFASVGGGATLKDASFDFGDSQKAAGIKPTATNQVKISHSYTKEGKYSITATLNFNTAQGVKSVTCKTNIDVSPESCPIKPSVPKNSPECQPCPIKPELPKDSPECKETPPQTPETPTKLPSTGVGAIAAGGLGVGSVVAAGGYYIRARRNLMSTFLNR